MKLPTGLLNSNGEPAKGTVVLSSHLGDREDLQEFGSQMNGNTASCYILTAPGDIIDLSYAFNPYVAHFVDIIVDGVRRKTFQTLGSSTAFRGTFDRVLHMGRINGNKRAGLKHVRMQVKARDTSKDIIVGDNDNAVSAVGSIILQIFQCATADKESDGENNSNSSVPVARYPDFEELADGRETPNHNKFHKTDVPSFQIDYIEPTKGHKALKDKVQKAYSSNHKLLATMRFELRSTLELRKMEKFGNVPEYIAPEYVPPATAAITAKTEKSKSTKATDDDISDVAPEKRAKPTTNGKLNTIAPPAGNKSKSTPAKLCKSALNKKSATPTSKSNDDSGNSNRTSSSPSINLLTSSTVGKPIGCATDDLVPIKTELVDECDNVGRYYQGRNTTTNSKQSNLSAEDLIDSWFKKPTLSRETLSGMPEAPAYNSWLKHGYSKGGNHVATSEEDLSMTKNLSKKSGNCSPRLEPAPEKGSKYPFNHLEKDVLGQYEAQSLEGERYPISEAGTTSTEIAPLEDVLAATTNSLRKRSTAVSSSNYVKSSKAEYSSCVLKGEFGQSQLSTQSQESQDPQDPLSASAGIVSPAGGDLNSIESSFRPSVKSMTPFMGLQTGQNSRLVEAPTSMDASKFTPAAKRKFAGVTSHTSSDGLPRKAASSPAYRCASIEQDVLLAKARIQAAEEKKRQLEAEYQKALLIEDERREVRFLLLPMFKANELTLTGAKILDEADRMERENAELQEKITAMYGNFE